MDVSLDERRLEDLAEQLRERQREKEELNQEARAWRASAQRYHERQQEEHRREWAAFHLSQAENLERTAVELAANHRARAEKLLGEEDA